MAKRQLDSTSSESEPLPAKRARLTRTGTEHLKSERRNRPGGQDSTTAKALLSPASIRLVPQKLYRPRPSSLRSHVPPQLCFRVARIGRIRPREPLPVGQPLTPFRQPVTPFRQRSHFETAHEVSARDGYTGRPYRPLHSGSVASSDLTGVAPSSGRSSGKSLVEDPFYRSKNLAASNVYMRHPCDPILGHIADLVDYVRQGRNSPGPSADELRKDRSLYDLSMGAGEAQVERYFLDQYFPLSQVDREPTMQLQTADGQAYYS
ncbi:hypothetical protein B0H63DRAFT_513437 [Podospora didyma]|uniref:Uncharacterized protein n=1 Tax=Podospora didyma TaxID=330526 RepID=A0AAE0K9F3_9PEZI|nr:hypothetical protein B0H63DRAFT_513437 [Podospora didyma]